MANPTPFAPASTAWADEDGAAVVVAAAAPGGRTALVAGASGLVGRAILQGLLADDTVSKVHALGRRQLPVTHPKLTQHTVDFASLPVLPAVAEVYLALGTTIKVAGSQQAFREVDYAANLAVARAARAQGATRLGMVSAMGADPLARIFYNRVKGELEQALSELGYSTLVIARPSVLVGDRKSLAQPTRPGETLALVLSRWLARVIPDDYKAIEAARVAAALLREVPATHGVRFMSSGEMRHAPAAATAA